MLRLSIFLSGLLVTPVADTVWWHTDGGSVTRRSDQSAQTCTLTIENNEGRFAFVWDRTLPAHIMAAQPRWRFAADQSTTAAMRMGMSGSQWQWHAEHDGDRRQIRLDDRTRPAVRQPLVIGRRNLIRTPDTQFGNPLDAREDDATGGRPAQMPRLPWLSEIAHHDLISPPPPPAPDRDRRSDRPPSPARSTAGSRPAPRPPPAAARR